MIDREKVIRAWELCLYDPDPGEQPKEKHSCVHCPYFSEYNFYSVCQFASLVKDTIALLKAQEPMKPEIEVLNEIDRLYRCPACHKYYFHKKQRFCDNCGKAVKWNG